MTLVIELNQTPRMNEMSGQRWNLAGNSGNRKTQNYGYTCTSTHNGNELNGELGWYRKLSVIQMNYVRSHATTMDTNSVVLTISGSDRRNWEIPDMKYYNLENFKFPRKYALQYVVREVGVTLYPTYRKFRPRNFDKWFHCRLTESIVSQDVP